MNSLEQAYWQAQDYEPTKQDIEHLQQLPSNFVEQLDDGLDEMMVNFRHTHFMVG